MKSAFITMISLAAFVATINTSCSRQSDEDAAPSRQNTCPVMKGKAINLNLYVDANGKRVYVCCPGCIVQVKADPEKYINEMEAEGIIVEIAPEDKEEQSIHDSNQGEYQD
jgi:hypothetical protein